MKYKIQTFAYILRILFYLLQPQIWSVVFVFDNDARVFEVVAVLLTQKEFGNNLTSLEKNIQIKSKYKI